MKRSGNPSIGRSVLLLKPRGRGGVATAVHRIGVALAPLAEVRVVPVGRTAGEGSGVRAGLRDGAVILRRAGRPTLVHVNTSLRPRAVLRDAALSRLARARGAAVLVQIHGWDRALVHERVLRSWGRVAALLRGAHAVAVVDPELRRVLRDLGVAPEALHDVANPFDPAECPGERVTTPPTILFLGRLVHGKGLELLVDAFHPLATRRSDVQLWVAGEGPRQAWMQSRVDALGLQGRVRFVGWVQGRDKAACFARASVLALPSVHEAAPLAVIEALAAGVPVVASATGAVPQLVGPAGRVLHHRDPASWAAALEAILDDPEAGAAGPARVARCHPEAVARQLMAIYASIDGR